MQRRNPIAPVLLAGLLLCAGCRMVINEGVRGDGDVTSVTREVEPFDAVELACQGDLFIALGDREELVIRAEKNLLEHITSEVHGRELTLRAERGVNLRPTRPIRYELTVRTLSGIRLTGSGDVVAPHLRSEGMDLALSGSGDLELQGLTTGTCDLRITGSGDAEIGRLEADALDLQITGSGDAKIGEGGAERFEAQVTGSGDCKAAGLKTRRAEVRISGSGGIAVHVDDELDCRITGSGDVRYTGEPDVDVTCTGSGRARRR
jgi:hypothetical protein